MDSDYGTDWKKEKGFFALANLNFMNRRAKMYVHNLVSKLVSKRVFAFNVLLICRFTGGESAWGEAFNDEFKPNLIHQGKKDKQRHFLPYMASPIVQ